MSHEPRFPALPTRRLLLAGALALGVSTVAPARTKRSGLSLALLGQCLIRHDLRARPWPGLAPLAAEIEAQVRTGLLPAPEGARRLLAAAGFAP